MQLSTAKKKASRKRLWIRLAVLFASVSAAILLVEALFAMFPSLLPEPIRRHLSVSAGDVIEPLCDRAYEHDPQLEHRAKSGFSGIEETSEFRFELQTVSLPGLEPWAWRSEAYDPQRDLDCLVVGDSFATGYGVALNQTLAGRIITHFRERGKQAFNLGLSNVTGTLQYEIILNSALEHYHPKRVVLLHFENDYLDNVFFMKWRKAQRSDEAEAFRFPQSRRLWESVCADSKPADSTDQGLVSSRGDVGLRAFLYRHSAIWNLLKFTLRRPPYHVTSTGERLKFGSVRYTAAPEFRDQCTRQGRPCVQEGFEHARDALSRMQTILDRRGIRLCVVLIPFKESLLDAEDVDVARFHFYRNELASHLREVGATVIDPLPDWKPVAREEQIYFPADGHWTALGHRLAYEMVEREFLTD